MDWTPQGCISPQSRRSRGTPKPNATPSGGAKSYDCIPGSISRPVARGGACLDNSDPRPDRETAATGKPLGCSFQRGALGLSHPVSASMPPVTSSRSAIAQAVAPPPRTRDLGPTPTQKALTFQPPELAALEEDICWTSGPSPKH